MVDNNDPLFREVEAELQREKWAKLWEQYGTYLVLGVATLVLGVGGFQFYSASRRAAAEAAGAKYETAVKFSADGKFDDATKSLQELAANGPSGYATLARLQQAGVLLKQQKRADALAVFEALSDDAGADVILRDYARLQAASLRSGEADWTEMQNRLTGLLGDQNPWRYSARTLLAVSAFKASKLDEARKMIEPLKADPGTPAEMAQRVEYILGSIVEAEQAVKNPVPIEPPAPPAAAQPAGPAAAGDGKTTSAKPGAQGAGPPPGAKQKP